MIKKNDTLTAQALNGLTQDAYRKSKRPLQTIMLPPPAQPAKVDVAGQPTNDSSAQGTVLNIAIAATDTDTVRSRALSTATGYWTSYQSAASPDPIANYHVVNILGSKAGQIADTHAKTTVQMEALLRIQQPQNNSLTGGNAQPTGDYGLIHPTMGRGVYMRGLVGGAGIQITYDSNLQSNVISSTATSYNFHPTNFIVTGQDVLFKLPTRHAANTATEHPAQKLQVASPLTLTGTVDNGVTICEIGLDTSGLGSGGSYPTPIAGTGIQIDWAADGSDYTISATGGSGSTGLSTIMRVPIRTSFEITDGYEYVVKVHKYQEWQYTDGVLMNTFAVTPDSPLLWDGSDDGFRPNG